MSAWSCLNAASDWGEDWLVGFLEVCFGSVSAWLPFWEESSVNRSVSELVQVCIIIFFKTFPAVING